MRPVTPGQPPGHGAPLDREERQRLDDIAQRHADDLGPLLRWPALRGPRGSPHRRVLRPSGWPAWVALLLGAGLLDTGVRADQGWPLLAGTVLVVTFHHWLAVPRLAVQPAAGRARCRRARTARR